MDTSVVSAATRLLSSCRTLPVLLAGIGVFTACQPQTKQSAHSDGPDRTVKLMAEGHAQASVQKAEPQQPEPTKVEMRNVILREDGGVSLRVQRLRGRLYPTRLHETPSFDDRTSFFVQIDAGVVSANLPELAKLLNKEGLTGSALRNVSLRSEGNRLKVRGTLHKGISFPVEMTAELGVSEDGRIRLHASKLRVLKMPVGGLLKTFHITVDDLVTSNSAKGLEIVGNNIYINQEKLLPPPQKRGKLVGVHLSASGDVVEIYGKTKPEFQQTGTWRNFISMQGGTFNFGRLTMHRVDLVMIDLANDRWFDFDVARYQEQLVNGYTHLTPDAGLQVFMPDISQIPKTAVNQGIFARWMQNRYLPSPSSNSQ